MSHTQDSNSYCEYSGSKRSIDETRDMTLFSASKQDSEGLFEDSKDDSNFLFTKQPKLDSFLTPQKMHRFEYLRAKFTEPTKELVQEFLKADDLGKRSAVHQKFMPENRLEDYMANIYRKEIKASEFDSEICQDSLIVTAKEGESGYKTEHGMKDV